MSVKAKVMAFRRSGKYYACHEVVVKPEHVLMPGFDVLDLIEKNDPSVAYLSPLTSKFGSDEFYHTVDFDYGEGINGFCTYLILPSDMRRKRG